MATKHATEPDNILDILTGGPAVSPHTGSNGPVDSTADGSPSEGRIGGGGRIGDGGQSRLELELAKIHGVSPQIARRLVERFDHDRDAIATASLAALTAVQGVGRKTAQHIQRMLAPTDGDLLESALTRRRRSGQDLSRFESVKLRADARLLIADVAHAAGMEQQMLLSQIVRSWANAHADELARLGIQWKPQP